MWGNARAVRIPKAVAQQLGLDAGTEVSLTVSRQGLLLKPVKRRAGVSLAKLLTACKGKNPHREAIRGRAGREVF
jgi:antitoxin component of MazEF toxin-antitoxin module